jgi:hypothetical protein
VTTDIIIYDERPMLRNRLLSVDETMLRLRLATHVISNATCNSTCLVEELSPEEIRKIMREIVPIRLRPIEPTPIYNGMRRKSKGERKRNRWRLK